jgi:hypothetical protein
MVEYESVTFMRVIANLFVVRPKRSGGRIPDYEPRFIVTVDMTISCMQDATM